MRYVEFVCNRLQFIKIYGKSLIYIYSPQRLYFDSIYKLNHNSKSDSLQGTTEVVEAVKFSLFTDEEVRKHSFKKITSPLMIDSVERPVPGGLYDPALGPIDENSP